MTFIMCISRLKYKGYVYGSTIIYTIFNTELYIDL